MKEEIQYKRNLSHNYLIIKGEEKEEDFQLKMLLHNQIDGLLEIQKQMIDGEINYYYEISSKQPMSRFFDKIDMNKEQLASILWEINGVMERMKEYLMDGSYLVLEPNYLYFDVETMKIGIIFYPDYEKTLKESFCELAEYILEKIDHCEEQGVFMAYQLYKITKKQNFTWFEILSILDQKTQEIGENKFGIQSERDQSNNYNLSHSEVAISAIEFQQNLEDTYYKELRNKHQDSNNKENQVNQLLSQKNSYHTYPKKKNRLIDYFGEHTKITEKSGNKMRERMNQFIWGIIGFVIIIIGTVSLIMNLLPFETNIVILGMGAMSITYMGVKAVLIKRRLANEEELCEITISQTKEKGTIEKERIRNDRSQNRNCNTKKEGSHMTISHEGIENKSNKEEKIEINQFFQKKDDTHGNTILVGTEIYQEERRIRGKLNGKKVEYSLEKLPITIGKMKDLVDITINEKEVSRIHARFIEKNNQVYLEDLNSTNGTYKNGISLETNEIVLVEQGDEIVIGKNSFTYF